MITVHGLIQKCWSDVIDTRSTVCVQAVRINDDGKPEVYIKEVQTVAYDHKKRKLILK